MGGLRNTCAVGDHTPGEPDLEPIDLTDPMTPPPRSPRRLRRNRPEPRRESSRQDSRSRLVIVALTVAALSASAAVAATLALTHRTLGNHSASQNTATTRAPAANVGTLYPNQTLIDGWTIATDLDNPPPGDPNAGGVVRFRLIDHYQRRPAGAGQKWLVVNVDITNNQASARQFAAARMVELNAYELKLYGIDPASLAQFRNAVKPRETVRRVLLFRVPKSVNGMYLTFHPDFDSPTARGQAAVINLNCC